jgi:hypothetical protein
VFALFALEGCTVLGLGVGSSMPKYRPVALESAPALPERTEVEIETTDSLQVGASGPYMRFPRIVDGQAAGVLRGDIILEHRAFPSVVTRIPLEKVKVLRVQEGSYWAEGLGVGAVVDVVATVTILVVASSHPMPFKFSGPLFHD